MIKQCFRPKGFMFIITVLCGFIVLAASTYLLIYSIQNYKYAYILLSLVGFSISISEIIKMLKYKVVFTHNLITITTQNFSWKMWQNKAQTILLEDIESITRTNIHILIKTKNGTSKFWILPFGKKQVNLITNLLNQKIAKNKQ